MHTIISIFSVARVRIQLAQVMDAKKFGLISVSAASVISRRDIKSGFFVFFSTFNAANTSFSYRYISWKALNLFVGALYTRYLVMYFSPPEKRKL